MQGRAKGIFAMFGIEIGCSGFVWSTTRGTIQAIGQSSDSGFWVSPLYHRFGRGIPPLDYSTIARFSPTENTKAALRYFRSTETSRA